jgi:hypothetical protein
MDGIYLIEYQGAAGAGNSVIVGSKGHLVGADITGSVWHGTYSQRDEEIQLTLSLQINPGVQTVQGPMIEGQPFSLDLSFTIREDQIGGTQFPVQTPLGIVLARIRKLADLPQ